MKRTSFRKGAGRFGLLSVLLTALALAGSSAAVAAPACALDPATGQTTCTFSYTGAVESWVVPLGVSSVTIESWGGQGATRSFTELPEGVTSLPTGKVAGFGGDVKGSVAVVGGSVLDVTVAQDGVVPPPFAAAFGGGGTAVGGNNGGGASSVAVDAGALLLVAGGGGGAGGDGYCPMQDANGNHVPGPATVVLGGSGGNADADGQLGVACEGNLTGFGGKAGASATSTGENVGSNSGHGGAGAGAGGYRGGGAGGISGCSAHCIRTDGGGGGGGGTNFTDPSLTGASVGLSSRAYGENGQVTIVYSSLGDQLEALATASSGVGPGRALSFTVTAAQRLLANGRARWACVSLGVFRLELRVFTPRMISPAQAAPLYRQASVVMSTLGC